MSSPPANSIQQEPEKVAPAADDSISKADIAPEDSGEIFHQAEYRALGWIRAGVILIKLCFATGVLAIPSAFSTIGYAPGIILLVCWGSLTTYYAYIMYAFRMRYPGVHNIADAAGLMGGRIAREIAGALFLLTWVVGVTQVDRPAAAPQEGPYDLGVVAVGSPTFVPGFVAAINLFAAYGSTPTFMPVIAEMKAPRAFTKSLFSSQLFLAVCYISFAVVVYVYCGQYVASPSLASAGGLLEKIAYGISIPGFIMTSTLWVHLAAKFLLVRVLRNSVHLQDHSFTHWAVWL
ncbi:hypothetical protein SBRCBS47491_009091 [Sporothrix bragantina]|uniref:Amino acid transporter transmembrane domain-containing protein n=1 Tax=Sporothrix bragantina TaxID=671064 RepID=A0ABP0CUZ7_9PEZI